MAESKADAIHNAAKAYGIPEGILWGVYGLETSFGSNVSTSSAGAKGSFQFIQSTAKTYNYPYTNASDPATFRAQANAAAHYLRDLVTQHGGNWDQAIKGYSGGGYGIYAVQKKAKEKPKGKAGETLFESVFGFELLPGEKEGFGIAKPENPIEAAKTAAKGVLSPLETLGEIGSHILGWIEEPITPVKFIGGAIIVYMGLRALSETGAGRRATSTGSRTAAHAAEVASIIPATRLAAKRARLNKPKASASNGS